LVCAEGRNGLPARLVNAAAGDPMAGNPVAGNPAASRPLAGSPMAAV
jgi:hypothetical protein